jgi:hypothetical protein
MASEVINVRVIPEPANAKRILIGIVLPLGLTAAFIFMQRALSNPDSFLTIKMRGLATVQEYADSRARFWHDIAAKASDAYLASRV